MVGEDVSPGKRREAQINQLRACLFPQHRSQWTGPDISHHILSFLTLSHMMFIAQKTRVSDAWVKPTFAVDRYGAFDAQHSDAQRLRSLTASFFCKF